MRKGGWLSVCASTNRDVNVAQSRKASHEGEVGRRVVNEARIGTEPTITANVPQVGWARTRRGELMASPGAAADRDQASVGSRLGS